MKKLRKLLFSSLLLLACGLTACHETAIIYNFETVRIGDITEHGIHIRRLATGNDENGHPYQTLSYTTVPAYTKEAVTASISFADNRNNGSSFLTCSLDALEHTVTVTCLQAFDSLGTLRLTCPTSQAYADVIIHYYSRINGIAAYYGGTGTGLNGQNADGNVYLYDYDSNNFNTSGLDKSEPLGHVVSNAFKATYATGTDNSICNYTSYAFFTNSTDVNNYYDSNSNTFTGQLPSVYTSTNSAYCQYGSFSSYQNPGSSWTTGSNNNVQNFFKNAIHAVDMNGNSQYAANIYYQVWTAWQNASTSVRNALANAQDGGYWYVRFQLRNSYVALGVENYTLGTTHLFQAETSDHWIYLRIQTIPDMGIGDSANSVSSESVSLYF